MFLWPYDYALRLSIFALLQINSLQPFHLEALLLFSRWKPGKHPNLALYKAKTFLLFFPFEISLTGQSLKPAICHGLWLLILLREFYVSSFSCLWWSLRQILHVVDEEWIFLVMEGQSGAVGVSAFLFCVENFVIYLFSFFLSFFFLMLSLFLQKVYLASESKFMNGMDHRFVAVYQA